LAIPTVYCVYSIYQTLSTGLTDVPIAVSDRLAKLQTLRHSGWPYFFTLALASLGFSEHSLASGKLPR
jgi:hypothetical protein